MAEPQLYREDVNTQVLAVAGVVAAVAVFAAIAALQAVHSSLTRAEEDRKYRPPERLRELAARQRGQLYGYRWVDAQQKLTAIPIGQAMELTVREWQAKQTETGGPR